MIKANELLDMDEKKAAMAPGEVARQNLLASEGRTFPKTMLGDGVTPIENAEDKSAQRE